MIDKPLFKQVCAYCGKDFTSVARTAKWCSPSCYGKSRRRFIECGICGKEFRATYKDHRYCSRACGNVAAGNKARINLTEAMLHEAAASLTVDSPSVFKMVAAKYGCSAKTVSTFARNIGFVSPPRPREKPRSKERAYVYSIGCVICGEHRVVDCAHLIPRVDGGIGLEGNIIPLCPTHHRCYDTDRLTENEYEKLVDFLYVKFPSLKEDLDNAKEQELQASRTAA